LCAQSTQLKKEEDEWDKAGKEYEPAAKCVTCHTLSTAEGKKSFDFVLMAEYSIWKTHDKHAQAYAMLLGPQGKLIGDRLGLDIKEVKTGCLNCHAMSDGFGKVLPDALQDGVSCCGCHGPSGGKEPWSAT